MEPLGIAASITALVSATTEIPIILMRMSEGDNAHQSAATLVVKIIEIREFCYSLQACMHPAKIKTRHRNAFIRVEDLAVILTQTIISISHLRMPINLQADWATKETMLEHSLIEF